MFSRINLNVIPKMKCAQVDMMDIFAGADSTLELALVLLQMNMSHYQFQFQGWSNLYHGS
jgi:hypothetical protein